MIHLIKKKHYIPIFKQIFTSRSTDWISVWQISDDGLLDHESVALISSDASRLDDFTGLDTAKLSRWISSMSITAGISIIGCWHVVAEHWMLVTDEHSIRSFDSSNWQLQLIPFEVSTTFSSMISDDFRFDISSPLATSKWFIVKHNVPMVRKQTEYFLWSRRRRRWIDHWKKKDKTN